MNMEQRQRLMNRIHMLEGLLAYAERTGDEAEVARIRQELSTLVEQCGDGCCCFDAAVASEAIDGSLQSTNSTDAAFSSYVPSGWRAYTPLCWSACWFRWFEGDAVDARGQMGWPDRFAAALDNAGEVYNYYSTGDEVFHNTASTPGCSRACLSQLQTTAGRSRRR